MQHHIILAARAAAESLIMGANRADSRCRCLRVATYVTFIDASWRQANDVPYAATKVVSSRRRKGRIDAMM